MNNRGSFHGDPFASASTRRLPEQDDEFTSGESTKKAAEEANALAARYRSLLEQKDRMRATLQVLSVSEQARATLRSGTPDMRRGRGAEEALKVRPSRQRQCTAVAGALGTKLSSADDGRSGPARYGVWCYISRATRYVPESQHGSHTQTLAN